MSAKLARRPTAPVVAGAAGGSPLGVVLVWALAQAGIDMPAEVAAAVGSFVGALVGYFTKGGRL